MEDNKASVGSRSGLLFAALILLLHPILAQSQTVEDLLRPFYGYYDSQSLTTAIGNATVASGQVIPGRSSNPANLGLNRFGAVQMDFQHNSFNGPGVNSSSTKIGGAYGIFPIPVYQGSLVYGGGIQKITDFTGAYQNHPFHLTEGGGIYATEFGVAVEAAENLFLGASFQYLNGSDELSTSDADSNRFWNPGYSGYDFSLGFVNRTSPNLQIGASVQFPTYLSAEDKLTTWPVSAPEFSTSETWKYNLTRPMAFHFGFSLLYPLYSVFYEGEWTDWKDMKFASNDYIEGFVPAINRELNDTLRSTFTHHLGAALHLPMIPLHLYGGYQYLPVPFEGAYNGNTRQSLSTGASYLLNQHFSVHYSYSHYFWKYTGKAEAYDMLVFGTTYHF